MFFFLPFHIFLFCIFSYNLQLEHSLAFFWKSCCFICKNCFVHAVCLTTQKAAERMRKPQLEIVDCFIVIFSSSNFMTLLRRKKRQRYKMAVKKRRQRTNGVKDKERISMILCRFLNKQCFEPVFHIFGFLSRARTHQIQTVKFNGVLFYC